MLDLDMTLIFKHLTNIPIYIVMVMIHVSHKNKFKCGLHFSYSSRIKKNLQ